MISAARGHEGPIKSLATNPCTVAGLLKFVLYKAADSELCDLCKQPETVRHFVLDCVTWVSERQQWLIPATSSLLDLSFAKATGHLDKRV